MEKNKKVWRIFAEKISKWKEKIEKLIDSDYVADIEEAKTAWKMIADNIDELDEKVNEIYYLQQDELADKYKAKVEALRASYIEKLQKNSNQILYGDFDEIINGQSELKRELDNYLNGEGKEIANRLMSERYNRKIGEITTGSNEITTEELWIKVQNIAEQLKIDCEKNPRLEAEQIDKVIAKQVLRILRIQAKRGEEIDLPKAEELCSKEDLLCAIKDKLNDMARHEESVEKKDELFEKSRYLEEESLKDSKIWKMLTGIQDVKIVGEKKEIEIKKAKFIFPQIKYEGLGLEKIPGISVYTLLKDIDEDTGEKIFEKKYGRFPRDFGNKNDRVEQIEINGVSEIEEKNELKRYLNLKSVIIGENVKFIGNNAFKYCENLESVEIGDSVKGIGYSAFYGCRNLKKVDIGKGVETIGKYSFSNCGLKDVYIPKNVEKLESGAFYECYNLMRVEIGDGKKEIISRFDQDGYFEPFGDTPAWENGNIEISDNTEIQGDYSIFTLGEIDSETDEIKNVRRVLGKISEIPKYRDQVLEIEINDFRAIGGYDRLAEYPNLERVNLGKNVKYILYEAFKDCEKLESVEMNDSIEKIGKLAFCNSGIKEIKIPNSVKEIGEGAFSDCSNLTKVELGTRLNKIPSKCFARNVSLTEVIIQQNLPIADDAFYNCPQTITIIDPYDWVGDTKVSNNGTKKQYEYR